MFITTRVDEEAQELATSVTIGAFVRTQPFNLHCFVLVHCGGAGACAALHKIALCGKIPRVAGILDMIFMVLQIRFGACTPHYFRGLGHHGRLKQQAKHFAAQDFTIIWPPGIYEATYLGAEEFSACTNTQAKFLRAT